ncbi:MAG TPA: sensor histidine kinase [Rugosimonospora sp.]|nr:sensor histidine kinase [Rugosimonospora sp.]
MNVIGVRGALRRVRAALFDGLVSLLIVFATVISFPRASNGLPMVLIGLGMAAALLARRRYPLLVTALVSALALAQLFAYSSQYDPRPFDAAVLVAMYSTVKYAPRLADGLLAALPVATGIVIELVRHPQRNAYYVGAFYLAVCGGTWLAGYTVRTRRQYVAGLEERAATAERERDHLARIAVADERASIARELHDVVAHSLAVMIVQADGATYALDGEPDQARVAIKQVAATGRDALEDMRRLVGVLRGSAPDGAEASTVDDPRRRITLDQLDALVARARSAGLPVTMTADGERPALPAAVELTVYRLVQEALTNVLRHAGPGAVTRLAIRYAAQSVEVEMVDDGGGTLAGQPYRPGGHGLVGMRERVAVHGGEFEAGPILGGGWRVRATVPFGGTGT